MRHGKLCLGDQLFQLRLKLVEVANPRYYAERLPPAVQFAQNRFAQDHWVVGQHESPHREAIDRRRRDDAHFPHPR